MTSKQLVEILRPKEIINPQDLEFADFFSDSREVSSNSVYFAIKGTAGDGHKFLNEVMEKGATALVIEDKSLLKPGYSGLVLVVENSRKALDIVSDAFFKSPSSSLGCVGVTGTNGKTTTVYLLEQIFNSSSQDTGVLGTIDHHFKEKIWKSDLTTPPPKVLQKRLSEFLELGAKNVALEASSHALDQARLDSLNFDVAIFTNLTRDHLDYHKDMESYFAAKKYLFCELLNRSNKKEPKAVINIQDPWGEKLAKEVKVPVLTYGMTKGDFQITRLDESIVGIEFEILDKTQPTKKSVKVRSPMVGSHNAFNILGAQLGALAMGISLRESAKALMGFYGAPGRLERILNKKGSNVFVDYAHTDDALKNVLFSLYKIKPSGAKIITVFGCGGDRDKGKRPLMAKVASQGSDLVIVTSDNPRTEDPNSIIDDIEKGMSQKWEREVDREVAIKKALEIARSNDIVLIAGKGHEDYQIIGTEKKYFSDQKIVREF